MTRMSDEPASVGPSAAIETSADHDDPVTQRVKLPAALRSPAPDLRCANDRPRRPPTARRAVKPPGGAPGPA